MKHDKGEKVALVTGGARRIGAVLVRALHQQGYRVGIHYRHSAADAEALAQELNQQRPDSACALAADLENMAEIRTLATTISNRWNRLDALINNASDFYPTPIETATEQDWQRLMASNLQGPFFLIQALLAPLRASHGSVVNLIDIHAQRPLAEHPIYCAAKAGLAMLTQALARDLGPAVRVNGIAPGAILWPESTLTEASATDAFTRDEQALLTRIPAARMGQPSDIARTALFLIDDAPYITGQILAVDGGRSLL